MNPQHTCDPLPDMSPTTSLRVLRLLSAALADARDDHGAIIPILAEIGDCPECLRLVLMHTTGWTVGLLLKHEADPELWIDFTIAQAPDRQTDG